MIYKLRLYRTHDYDLLLLHQNRQLTKTVREALQAVCDKTEYKFAPTIKHGLKKTERMTEVRVKITEPDSIKLIGKIGERQRSAYIKSVVRAALANVEVLYLDAEAAKEYEKKEKKEVKKEEKKEQVAEEPVEKKEPKQKAPEHKFIMTPQENMKLGEVVEDKAEEEEEEFSIFDMVEVL